MKKIYSLLCALAIVFSAVAAPQYSSKRGIEKHGTNLTKKESTFSKQADPNQTTPKASKAPKAAAGETINLNFSKAPYSAKYYADTQDWYIVAQNGDYRVALDILSKNSEALPAGTYNATDFALSYTGIFDLEVSSSYPVAKAATASATVVVTGDRTDITAVITGTDGNTYNVTMFNAPVVPSGDTVALAFTVPMEIPLYYTDGSWDLVSESVTGDTVVAFVYNSEDATSPAGSFTENDLQLDYSAIVLGDETIAIAAAEIVVTESADSINLAATVVGIDAVTYLITMFFDKPVATEQKTFTSSEIEVDDALASWFGVVFVTAVADKDTLELTLNAEEAGAALAGTYVAGTDFNGSFTYASTGEKDEIYSGSLTIAISKEGLLSISGKVLTLGGIEYTIDIAGEYDGKEHLEYDAKEDFIVDFPNPQVILEYVASDGLIYVVADNEDLSTITLEFPVAKTATDLAAGTYAIDATGAEGTVSAGAGLDEEGYIVGSFAGYRNANNQITAPLWWIVSGTVTVAENGIITVDAVNSYDKAIKCKLGKDNTAVDNINADAAAVKRIDNGQLIIRKNGTDYNVMGVVIR